MRTFEVKAIKSDKYEHPMMLVFMDLETYNDALNSFIFNLKDEYFNNGYSAATDEYPTEEEIIKQSINLWNEDKRKIWGQTWSDDSDADMDDDRTEDNS